MYDLLEQKFFVRETKFASAYYLRTGKALNNSKTPIFQRKHSLPAWLSSAVIITAPVSNDGSHSILFARKTLRMIMPMFSPLFNRSPDDCPSHLTATHIFQQFSAMLDYGQSTKEATNKRRLIKSSDLLVALDRNCIPSAPFVPEIALRKSGAVGS